MISRIQRYVDNHGPQWAVVNLVAIGYMSWLVVRSSSKPIGLLILPTAAAVLLVTYLASDWMARHYGLTNRVLRTVQWIVIGMLVVDWAGVINWHGLVWLAMFPVALTFMCASFWVASHPNIYTGVGMERIERRFERKFDRAFGDQQADDPDRPHIMDR